MSLRNRRSDVHRRSTRRRPSLESLEGRQLLSLGQEFTVNTITQNAQYDSAVAKSSNGMSVVVWTHAYSPTDHDIHAQLYNRFEQKQGPEILIAGSILDDNSASVAMDPWGNFVVAWTQTQPGGDTNVLAHRFNSLGGRVGTDVQVGVGTFKEHDPAVAMDEFGRFTVAYVRDTNNNNPDVFAKRFDINNNLINVFRVGTSSKAETHPSIAMTPQGSFDVAYQVQFSSYFDNVDVALYTAGGSPLGTSFVAYSNRDMAPSIAMDDFGNAVVAYQKTIGGSHYAIKAMRVSSDGSTGNEITIQSSSVDNTSPAVALKHGGGAFVVAYDSSTRVKVTEVTGADIPVATYDAGAPRTGPAISIDGLDRYMLTYTSLDFDTSPPHSRNLDIKGRFGTLFWPQAIVGL
jgi:hypothetical protein